MIRNTGPEISLLEDGSSQTTLKTPRPSAAPEKRPKSHGGIVCATCGELVTTKSERMERDGAHRHVFMNPGGHMFEIGCFAKAPGCATAGDASGEFSWFPGCLWRIGVCKTCLTQLGWRFEDAAGGFFFGLILNRLKEVEGEKA